MTKTPRVSITEGENNVTNALQSYTQVGNRVFLRPLFPEDDPFLYAISTAESTRHRWRHRGAVLSPEQFRQDLWSQVLSQQIVSLRQSREPIGLVVCHNANFIDGWAYLAVLSSPRYINTGAIIEGVTLFLDEIFRTWNFRKLYMELPEFNLVQIKSGIRGFFHEEGRLREHHFYDGQYYDQVLLALYRSEYEEVAPFLRQATYEQSNARNTINISSRRELPDEVLDLDEFCKLLAIEFDRGVDCVMPDTYIVDDLGFDSLEIITLLVLLEELSDNLAELPYHRITTVRDIWLYYCELLSMPRSDSLIREDI